MEEEEGREDPMCPTCKHRHVEGVKCRFCPHVGKSSIFSQMKVHVMINRFHDIVRKDFVFNNLTFMPTGSCQ